MRRYERGYPWEIRRRRIRDVALEVLKACVRSGQGGLRVLQMYLKNRYLPAVLGGAMIFMGRLLEKLGPKG
jgi:hypothetical protein